MNEIPLNLGLLTDDELPDWFRYPADFINKFEPLKTALEWGNLLRGEELRFWTKGLADRYPDRGLVPIIRSWASDDIICWDRDKPSCVAVIHDFASPGWEGFAGHYASLGEWLMTVGVDWNSLGVT